MYKKQVRLLNGGLWLTTMKIRLKNEKADHIDTT